MLVENLTFWEFYILKRHFGNNISMSKGVDDVDGVRLPTPVGIILHVQTGHAMSSTVDVEVGPGFLQQAVPVEVGIGAGEARLMEVVVFKTVMAYIPSQSTAG